MFDIFVSSYVGFNPTLSLFESDEHVVVEKNMVDIYFDSPTGCQHDR